MDKLLLLLLLILVAHLLKDGRLTKIYDGIKFAATVKKEELQKIHYYDWKEV